MNRYRFLIAPNPKIGLLHKKYKKYKMSYGEYLLDSSGEKVKTHTYQMNPSETRTYKEVTESLLNQVIGKRERHDNTLVIATDITIEAPQNSPIIAWWTVGWANLNWDQIYIDSPIE